MSVLTVQSQPTYYSTLVNYVGLNHIYNWYVTDNLKLGRETEFKLLDKIPNLVFKEKGHPALPPTYTKNKNEYKGKLAEILLVEVADDQYINTLKISDGNSENRKLVLAHGFGVGIAVFYNNLEPLIDLKGWDIFVIDWLGMGLSSRPKFNLKPKHNQTELEHIKEAEDFFVESFEIWCQKLNLDKFTFFGHSLGGYLATVYTLKYHHKVDKLILASPVGIPQSPFLPEIPLSETKLIVTENQQDSDEPVPINIEIMNKIPFWVPYLWNQLHVTPQYLVRLAGPFGTRLVDRYASRRFQHLESEDRALLRDYLLHTASLKGSGEYAMGTILSFGAFARNPLKHRLPEIQTEVTFVYGENDWMDHRHALKVQPKLKVSNKMVILDGVGHQLFVENPNQFNNFLIKELNEYRINV